jgi:hypothetical protein
MTCAPWLKIWLSGDFSWAMVEGALPRYRVLGITLESSFPFCTPLPPSPCPPDLRFSMEAKDLAAPPAASVLPAFESLSGSTAVPPSYRFGAPRGWISCISPRWRSFRWGSD